jgi:hypothetical protein
MWMTLSDERYNRATKDIKRQRDRGAAIIAAALLEDHLVAAIKARLERHPIVENKMFNGYGSLASFSARIDFGLLLGLYDSKVCKQLHRIRNIRNEFAHNVEATTFESQRIRDLCAHLALPSVASRRIRKAWADAIAGARSISEGFDTKQVNLKAFRKARTHALSTFRQSNCIRGFWL